MAAKRVVIDTGIFIEFLRKRDKTKTLLYKLSDDADIFISSVTLYELLMGATTDQKVQDVRLLTEDLTVFPFSRDVAWKAARIYHELRTTNKMIEFRDIFIAATCIVNKSKIYTLNRKHIKRIKGISFWN